MPQLTGSVYPSVQAKRTLFPLSPNDPENGLHPPLCIRIQVPHHGECLAAVLPSFQQLPKRGMPMSK